MIKIYDDEQMRTILEKIGLPNGTYIHLNLRHGTAQRSSRKGLDLALEQTATPEQPTVLYSFEAAYSLFQDKRFMRAMAQPNFHFLRLPFAPNEISDFISLPTFRNRALEIAADSNEKVDLLKVLRHDYHHHPEDSIRRAREELNLTGTDQNIVYVLESSAPYNSVRTIGKLPGVFCDVEGTLFRKNEINQEVMLEILNYSLDHPVTFWTGGDLKAIVETSGRAVESFCDKLMKETGSKTNLHLRTPVLSKHIFRGAQPEIVIDDLTLAEFKAQYEIEPESYIRV